MTPIQDQLPPADSDVRRRMDAAAGRLFGTLEHFAALGRPPLIEVLGGRSFVEWEHYPERDLFDPTSGVLLFYHAHAQGDRSAAENGHFHCFVARSKLRRRTQALAKPSDRTGRALCHLVGVSVDAQGVPRELFTTRPDVTGEWLYPADQAARLLACFAEIGDEAPLVAQWVSAVVTLFEPDVAELLRRRDQALGIGGDPAQRLRRQGPEITSATEIDIDARLALLGAL